MKSIHTQKETSAMNQGIITIAGKTKEMAEKLFAKEAQPFATKFCDRPFQWLDPQQDGEVFVCCPAWLPKSIGNLNDSTPSEVWNSKAARDIRKSIIDGSFKYCRKDLSPRIKTNTLQNR